jgi:hypothetical protein
MTALLSPSEGGRGLLNPKAIGFGLFVPSFFLWLLSERKIGEKDLLPLTGFFFLLFGMSAWIGVSFYREVAHMPSLIDQTKVFFITFIPFFGALIMARRGLFSFSTLIKTLIYSNALYSLIKIIFLILFFLKIISLETFLEFTGIRLMTLNVADSFERLLTSCDLFTPFLLFFVVAREHFKVKLSKFFVGLYIPLSIFSIIIGFSRVFLAIGLAALLLALLLDVQKKIIMGLYLLVFAGACTVIFLGPQKVINIVEMRFVSSENQASDDTRKDQISALIREIEKYPLIGLGMGGHSREVIRDLDTRHLYEVQWLAIFAQFGWLGIIPLFGSIVVLLFSFLLPPFSLLRFFLFILYLGWVFSGATNPFVLSLASGVMYTLFALALYETCHLYPTREIAHQAPS